MDDTPLRFAVLAEDPALLRLLQNAFDGSGVESDLAFRAEATLEEGVKHLARLRWAGARILLGQVGQDLGAAVEALRRVAAEAPGMIVMLAGPPLPSDALLEVIRAGAVEYLPSPVSAGDIQEALSRVIRRRAAWKEDVHREATTYAIFGAKGGSGVTTTAVNLALELRQRTGEPTLLVDLDLMDGGAEAQLDLHARYTLLDVVGNFHRLDEGLLHSFVLAHPSGLDVLAAPRMALEGEKLGPDEVSQLVRMLRVHYRRIVLDVGNVLRSVSLAALAEADELALVVMPHLECLRNAKRIQGVLGQRTLRSNQSAHVVLNRYESDPPIAIEEIERALGSRVRTILPFDDAMMRRNACGGRPAAIAGGPSKYAKNLGAFAVTIGQLDDHANRARPVRSWFGALLRRNGKNGKNGKPERTARPTRIPARR